MHQLWHVVALGATLFAAAGAVIVVVGPLVFDMPPPGQARARRLVLGLAVPLAMVLLATEWLAIH